VTGFDISWHRSLRRNTCAIVFHGIFGSPLKHQNRGGKYTRIEQLKTLTCCSLKKAGDPLYRKRFSMPRFRFPVYRFRFPVYRFVLFGTPICIFAISIFNFDTSISIFGTSICTFRYIENNFRYHDLTFRYLVLLKLLWNIEVFMYLHAKLPPGMRLYVSDY
jgi:hypothetical protein